MSRFPDNRVLAAIAVAGILFSAHLLAGNPVKPPGYYGYGEAATAEQIAGWDIDVRPDGKGLPPGSGSVVDGEILYEEQCAECHGSFGEGEGRYPSLAGGEDSLRDERPHKTVGSYWNYTSTLWDYIHRAMPFSRPESLSDDEVYAVTAYVLYLNDLVDDEFVLSQQNLTGVRLPNEANFIAEQRPDVNNSRCMKNCRDPDAITILSEAPLYVPESLEKTRAEATSPPPGEEHYMRSCALCHDSGIGGAPVVGNAGDWTERAQQGIEALYSHAIDGFQGESGMMPAKGGFAQLTDDDVKAAVDYMLEKSQ
jgi:cytochrome c